jgi:Protein of unknown function (DUF3892)
MAAYQVRCIGRDAKDADRRIDCLAGPGWIKECETVIAEITLGVHSYWTLVNGYHADIVVCQYPGTNRPYLQTVGDVYPDNALLKLPDCV